jgi:hypothetical protein
MNHSAACSIQPYIDQGTGRLELTLCFEEQGMEETMLLFFYMPLIIASAMFQPTVARKPVDNQED